MEDTKDRKPAPSVAPLDATQLEGAMHLLDADEMARALDTHAARAMLFGDAPTSAPVQAEIDRLNATYARVEYRDCATAPAMPTPPHGHISDADAARDTLDDQADAAVAELHAKQLKERDDLLAVRDAQIVSLTAHNIELMRESKRQLQGALPVVAVDSDWDMTDATLAMQRAVALEDRGARCALRPVRDADGRIVGVSVAILRAVVDGEGVVGMAVTDGGDVAEWKEAA